MIEPDYLLFFFEGLAALAVLGILFSKNVFYAVLLLMIFLLSLAGIYVILQAEVLAVTQILIYTGGVLVLILFGIMLTKKTNHNSLHVGMGHLPGGLLTGALILVALIYSLQNIPVNEINSGSPNHVQAMGTLLMSDYVLPFEVAGILLLVSLIGAVVGATSSKSES